MMLMHTFQVFKNGALLMQFSTTDSAVVVLEDYPIYLGYVVKEILQ